MLNIGKNKIEEISKLRRRGFSINEISRKSGISKTTVFRYVHDIKILPQYEKRWLERRNASKIISEKDWRYALNKSENLLESLDDRDLSLIGFSLYWAEGAKKDFRLSNTDPSMIKIFIYILRNVFKVEEKRINISLRIYEDLKKKECLVFWSKVTGIHLDKTTTIDVLRGKKIGKLKYGMCRVRVSKGGLLLKEAKAFADRVDGLISVKI